MTQPKTLPMPNTRMTTPLIRRLLKRISKDYRNNPFVVEPIVERFTAVFKRIEDEAIEECHTRCDELRNSTMTAAEIRRQEHIQEYKNKNTDLARQILTLNAEIERLHKERQSIKEIVQKSFDGGHVEWSKEMDAIHLKLTADMNAIIQEYRDRIDATLRKEFPEYCGD